MPVTPVWEMVDLGGVWEEAGRACKAGEALGAAVSGVGGPSSGGKQYLG